MKKMQSVLRRLSRSGPNSTIEPQDCADIWINWHYAYYVLVGQKETFNYYATFQKHRVADESVTTVGEELLSGSIKFDTKLFSDEIVATKVAEIMCGDQKLTKAFSNIIEITQNDEGGDPIDEVHESVYIDLSKSIDKCGEQKQTRDTKRVMQFLKELQKIVKTEKDKAPGDAEQNEDSEDSDEENEDSEDSDNESVDSMIELQYRIKQLLD